MHPLNTPAQLKCFFMNQQYHVAKRTKGLLDYVPLSCLYTPLNLHPVISLPAISVALYSSSVKSLKIYVPHSFLSLLLFKGILSYLPTLSVFQHSFVIPLFSPRSFSILPLTPLYCFNTFFKESFLEKQEQ